MEKIHKSYNARYMGFEDVARSFVPNSQFRELIRPESSIIVGPRGCGKTTLLKMLHPRAFVATQSETVKRTYSEMNFWGVYIPADIQWTTLLRKVEERESESNAVGSIVNTLISVNVLSSICRCFKSLLDLSISQLELSNPFNEKLSVDQIRTVEMNLAQDLVAIWGIEKDIPSSLYSIQQYWNTIVSNLNLALKNYTNCQSILLRYNGFLDYAHAAFDAFHERCKEINFCAYKGFRWALCFDELELAPKELRETISTLLRSTSYQEIIFKTTSSFLLNKPDASETDILSMPNPLETDAAEGHDYQNILNWVHDKRSEDIWESFCKELYSQQNEKSVIRSIGKYDLIKCVEDAGELTRNKKVFSDYKPGSLSYQLFVELAKVDASFNSFLQSKDIDPQNPYKEDDITYNLLKKIKASAICRYYFSKPRTMAPFYFGEDILYDFSEGNPRLAINIMNRMILAYSENSNLSIRRQSAVFYELSVDKMKFYEHYPNAEVKINSTKTYSLGEILKKIGKYFQDNLYVAPFSEVAKNTFYVDQQELPRQIVDLINTGIELGAIMKVDSTEVDYPVYKLAYILYPYFSLPKRLITTKPEKLSTILESVINKEQLKIEFTNDNQ